MARKSRKAIQQAAAITAAPDKSKAGIYVRLSVADNGNKSGDSIENQASLLKEYIDSHAEEFKLIKQYADNGASGTNFDRVAWNELMEDIKSGKINCIIVKDFSRLGRNYIEVGNYLEKIFPFLNVRVVAINESFDSKRHQLNEKMLISSLTNIVNEYYARDISNKITQTKRTMQRNGEFASSVLPYGYMRSEGDEKKLVIDPESSDVVKKIFEWRAGGKGCLHIARLLNELLLPSPGLYRYRKGNKSFQRCLNSKWQSKHVAGILVNPVYLGHMAQGKTRTSYFANNGKSKQMPKEDWIIAEHAHEAIATREQFDIADKMAEASKRKHKEQLSANAGVAKVDNPFAKKIYCGQCGRLLTRRSRVADGARDYTFFCNNVNLELDGHCTNTHIHQELLLKVVSAAVMKQFQIRGAMNHKWIMEYFIEKTRKETERKDRKIKELEEKRAFLKMNRQEMYADLREGLLTAADYVYGKEKLNKEIEGKERELRNLLSEIKPEADAGKIAVELKKEAQPLPEAEAANDFASRLVDKIIVYSPERIEITFPFAVKIEKWVQALKECAPGQKEAG